MPEQPGKPPGNSGYSARDAIRAGKVFGLSAGERTAILQYGADPAQVVNARRGIYTVGQYQYTREGVTRYGIAGTRMLRRAIDRADGLDTRTRIYTNTTISRAELAAARRRLGGEPSRRDGRIALGPRPTPDQIIAMATGRGDAIQLLTNFGYLI